jgi:hypothetical protein
MTRIDPMSRELTPSPLAPASVSRAEFRVFGHDVIEAVIVRLWNGKTILGQVRQMPAETYFLSVRTNEANVKVRDNLLDIKTLVERTTDGYEVFQPREKYKFPIRHVELNTVLRYLQVDVEDGFDQEVYSLDDVMKLMRRQAGIRTVAVEKLRHGFSIDGVICEFAQVWFNGALMETACVESDRYDAMRSVIVELGLDSRPNVNYLNAAKRVVGID